MNINASDLQKVVNAITAVAAILKQRFPNLTVNETSVLAGEIVQAVNSVTT